MLNTLITMFSYMRPTGTETEQEFVDRFLTPLGFERDPFKNLVLVIGDRPRVLFSSHMDTVHNIEGRQVPIYDGHFLTQKGNNCLGADDTAGVWLMTEMVKAKIPGVYVIHHAEESGCIGSRNLAEDNPDFFKDIDIAIAFDRANYQDIITHQMGQRTASDDFALSLARELDLDYRPSNQGVYTDTVEYAHLVAECTNVSVGYSGQHHANEKQDVLFLFQLRDALMNVDWVNLEVSRDPEETPSYYYQPPARSKSMTSLEHLVYDHPDVAAYFLESCGITAADFEDEVYSLYGNYGRFLHG